MKNKISTNIFIGIALLILGIGFFLNSLGYLNFGTIFSHYWPIFIILFALMKLLESRYTSALIWFILGSFLLINAATNIRINIWEVFWPILLIWIGISILLHNNGLSRSTEETKEDQLNSISIFGASDKKSSSNTFKGGNITAIFGGNQLDLRGAKIDEKGASIDVFAAFGGIEILAPKNLPIKLDVFALFGGSEDKREIEESADDKPKLTIRGTVVFGGIEIKEKP